MSWFSFAGVPETPRNFAVQMSTNWSDRSNAMDEDAWLAPAETPCHRGLLSPPARAIVAPAFLGLPGPTHDAHCAGLDLH